MTLGLHQDNVLGPQVDPVLTISDCPELPPNFTGNSEDKNVQLLAVKYVDQRSPPQKRYSINREPIRIVWRNLTCDVRVAKKGGYFLKKGSEKLIGDPGQIKIRLIYRSNEKHTLNDYLGSYEPSETSDDFESSFVLQYFEVEQEHFYPALLFLFAMLFVSQLMVYIALKVKIGINRL